MADLPFEIRDSPIQGRGAFATRYIPPGVRLIEYAGERLTPAEADELRQAMGSKRSAERMERLRRRLYAGMARSADSAAGHFHLPDNAVVELGTRVQL